MRAILVLRDRIIDEDGDLTELVLWQVPRTSKHPEGIRKGHHRHYGESQGAYRFSTVDQLLADFQADIRRAKAARKERSR